MSPLNPLFCLIVYAIAFFTAYLIQLKYKQNTTPARYVSIDGFRGFLAFGVFIHHAAIWLKYSITGIWEAPNSNLYNHFGQSSVGFFFMITSFLFVSQLLKSRETGYNWKALAISRFFRIFPLYYFILFIFFIIVFIISSWTIRVPHGQLFQEIKDWLLFTIERSTNVNNVQNTFLIGAGVAWSLAYEWLFYFSLPIISLFILKKRKKLWTIAISAAFIFYFIKKRGHQPTDSFMFYFIGGAIAPFLNKYSTIQHRINKNLLSVVVIICLGLLLLEHSAQNFYSLILNTIIFTIIATGNTMFGILEKPFLRLLGDISYSTYLLHGLVLFITLYFIIGLDTVKTFTPTQYCFVIFAITPIIVVVSFFSYRLIEKPFMNLGKRILKKD